MIASKAAQGTIWEDVFPDRFAVPVEDDPDATEKQVAMAKLMCTVYGGKWIEGPTEDGSSR